MVSRAVTLCGTELVDPPMRTLTAGPLSTELDNGALRYVRIGDVEVLRAIAFLVRDENWGTFTPTIEDLRIDESGDGFSVSYRGTCADAARVLVYDAKISGRSDGSLDFEVAAEPRTDVLTNRTGFIVLHPVEGVAGRRVKILHVDGREEDARFPAEIDPACPFRDIRAVSHEIVPGTWATCTMEGDAYEMEDQRNWSDASYKTYVRPLTKPWPYTLPRGVPVAQAIRLAISGPAPAASAGGADRRVRVAIGDEVGRLPAIGVSVPADEAAHAVQAAGLVQRLGPRSLVCEVDLRRGHGRAELDRYRMLADLTGAEIVLEIITRGTLDPLAELSALAEAAAEAKLAPAAICVFPAQDMKSVQPNAPWPEMPSFDQTYAAARNAFPGARLGGGMAAYFTELNRKRPPAALLDFVTHTTCPIVHAADDRSVMETIESLPYQIASTRAFMGDLPYRIGPSQIGCRENPYGKSTAPNPGDARVCLSAIDPRQRGLFNAAWTLAYIGACARGRIEAVAIGAPTGAFGHIYRRAGFVQPYFDGLDEHGLYPSFHVIAGLAPLAGARLRRTEVSPRGQVEALAVHDGTKTVLWLANLTDAPVTIDLPVGHGGSIVALDAEGFEKLTTTHDYLEVAGRPMSAGPLRLDAYAVARIVDGKYR
jgi:hypothetical protein